MVPAACDGRRPWGACRPHRTDAASSGNSSSLLSLAMALGGAHVVEEGHYSSATSVREGRPVHPTGQRRRRRARAMVPAGNTTGAPTQQTWGAAGPGPVGWAGSLCGGHRMVAPPQAAGPGIAQAPPARLCPAAYRPQTWSSRRRFPAARGRSSRTAVGSMSGGRSRRPLRSRRVASRAPVGSLL